MNHIRKIAKPELPRRTPLLLKFRCQHMACARKLGNRLSRWFIPGGVIDVLTDATSSRCRSLKLVTSLRGLDRRPARLVRRDGLHSTERGGRPLYVHGQFRVANGAESFDRRPDNHAGLS